MRLTKFYDDFEKYGFTKPCDDMEHLQLVADKLGKYEDLEQKFEIIDFDDLELRLFNCERLMNDHLNYDRKYGEMMTQTMEKLQEYKEVEYELDIDLKVLAKSLKNAIETMGANGLKSRKFVLRIANKNYMLSMEEIQ